jgi:hypothetical protein
MDDLEKIKPTNLIDFERPRLDDPLYFENEHPHGFSMDPNDGMPKPAINSTMTDTEAADLTPERFVCMGTKGLKLPLLGQVTGRKACVHYRRQLLPSQDKQNTVCIRLCAANLTEDGEMANLGDTEVLACELREPRDPASEARLDAFDEVIFERQRQRKSEDKPFDVDAALED